MSNAKDPSEEGGGGGYVDPSEKDRVSGSGVEHGKSEGRGEGGGGRGEGGGDAPKTASKGINPVQHSE